MKKKVAYLNHGLYFGGATASLYLLIKSVDSAQYDKYMYVTESRSEEMKNDFLKHCSSVDIVNVKQIHNNVVVKTPYWKCIIKSLIPCKAFVEKLVEKNIDILHINSTVFPQIHRRVKLNSRIKIVTHLREQIPKYGLGFVQRYMINQINTYSDALIAISENEARPFAGHKQLHILPNPFDFSKIANIEGTFRKANRIADDCILVGMMGQFTPSKGHMIFLEALKLLIEQKKAICPFQFVMIGVNSGSAYPKRSLFFSPTNAFENQINRYIADNELAPYIRLLPYSYKIFEILRDIDIMVRPSLSGDPWGRDIIESMAFEKPVIATGSSEFFIKSGENGYLIPQGNPVALASRILELINDPNKRKLLAKRAYQKINFMCDFSSFGKSVMRIYEAI